MTTATGVYARVRRAARSFVAEFGGRCHFYYDSNATPCGCVLTAGIGAVPGNVVLSRGRIYRCWLCECTWVRPTGKDFPTITADHVIAAGNGRYDYRDHRYEREDKRG